MTARDLMLSRLRDRNPETALERDFYCSPEDYQVDLEMIWYRDWLFVGHDCEVSNPGNYLTVQVGEYPILVVRDREGALHAFHNTCRHRGSRICSAEHGSSPRLVCPYHQWTYALDGRLIAARDMGGEFDKSQHGLRPVHCASVGGYIWICLAAKAPDFEPIRQHIEPYFLPHKLHQTKVAFQSTIIEQANWKLVWENNRECYHCAANHPELIRTFPEDPTATDGEDAASNPITAAKWARWESIGLPSKFHLSANGQYRTLRTPLLEGAVSFTMTGQAAVRRPLSDSVAEPDIGTLVDVPLSDDLEPCSRRPRHLVSGAAPQSDPNAAHHQVAGASRRCRGRRLRSPGIDQGVAGNQCGRYPQLPGKSNRREFPGL